jgi:hypothetical protein
MEAKIEELKALEDEGLRKLAKAEEAQALEANMRDLEGQLEFKRGQWMGSTRTCLTSSWVRGGISTWFMWPYIPYRLLPTKRATFYAMLRVSSAVASEIL